MRNKNVNQKTVDKYINFLNQVKYFGIDISANNRHTLEDIVSTHKVSKTVIHALKALKIIERTDKTKWTYEHGEPTKKTVLEILDYLLHRRKAQQPALSNEWVTIIDTLKEISSKIDKGLKTHKNAPRDMRFELMKDIAGGMYGNPNFDGIDSYTILNSEIIKATDDLLKQYQQTQK